MKIQSLALASALVLAVSGAAMAQTAAGGGSAEGNMNNPGSVKSNSEKAMERTTGSATGGIGATGSASGDVTGSTNGRVGTGTPGTTGGASAR